MSDFHDDSYAAGFDDPSDYEAHLMSICDQECDRRNNLLDDARNDAFYKYSGYQEAITNCEAKNITPPAALVLAADRIIDNLPRITNSHRTKCENIINHEATVYVLGREFNAVQLLMVCGLKVDIVIGDWYIRSIPVNDKSHALIINISLLDGVLSRCA